MKPTDIKYFHGTSAYSAERILQEGSSTEFLAEIGALELGREIWGALLKIGIVGSGKEYRLSEFVDCEGAAESELWYWALRGLEEPSSNSYFKYGAFYVTMNIANAYRYALTPFRSEFLLTLQKSLKVIGHFGHELPAQLPDRFPLINELLERPSDPTVLEVSGVTLDRLLTARDAVPVDFASVQRDLKLLESGFNVPADFRIKSVQGADVVAVHKVSIFVDENRSSGWRPDAELISKIRFSPTEWLSTANAAI